jgi:hypothetical protein
MAGSATHAAAAPNRLGGLRLLTVLVTAVVTAALTMAGLPAGQPSARAAGVNQYSAPEWLPVRAESPTSTRGALIGCARRSSGAHCDGGTYHGWWAIDFMAAVGTPVYAAGSGQVKVVRKGQTGCSSLSNAVQVNHNGSYTYYSHLDKVLVADGAWVDRNTQIGTVGVTGLAPYKMCLAPHLHYEKRTGTTQATAVDPGKLRACHAGKPVRYPDVTGAGTSWSGFPGHAHRASGQGTACGNRVSRSIRSVANGRFVSAELQASGNHYGKLRARATGVGGWEKFWIHGDCRSSFGCAIQSQANSKFVAVETAYTGTGANMLRARSDSSGAALRFGLEGDCRSTTGCAIKAKTNNRYVSAELHYTHGDYGMLRARHTSIGAWERFRVEPV